MLATGSCIGCAAGAACASSAVVLLAALLRHDGIRVLLSVVGELACTEHEGVVASASLAGGVRLASCRGAGCGWLTGVDGAVLKE